RFARRRFVEMHRLRIELGGEGDDLLARDQPRAVDGDRAGLEVLPMNLCAHVRIIGESRRPLNTHRGWRDMQAPQPSAHPSNLADSETRAGSIAQVANRKCMTSPSATT